MPDRATSDGPTGRVDSASGFYNAAKILVGGDGAPDRLDESPVPVLVTP